MNSPALSQRGFGILSTPWFSPALHKWILAVTAHPAPAPGSAANWRQSEFPVAPDQVTGRLQLLLSRLMEIALAGHNGCTPQRGEKALLQNGRGSQGIEVELHGYRLSIRGGHGAPPSDAQDPLHIVNTPIL